MSKIDVQAVERSLADTFREAKFPVEHLERLSAGETKDKVQWTLTTPLGKFFAKAITIPPNQFWQIIEQQGNAQLKNSLHNPESKFFSSCVGQYKQVIDPNGTDRSHYEFMTLPQPTQSSIYVEFQKLLEGPTYANMLDANLQKMRVTRSDVTHITQICELLNKVHTTPEGVTTADYVESLRALLRDMWDYIPIVGDHPILSEPEIKEGQELGWFLVNKWAIRSELPVLLHGDLWRNNIKFVSQKKEGGGLQRKLEKSFPALVDFHYRHNIGHRGFDVGRFFMDFLRLYLMTGNSYFKDMGDLLLDTYAEVAGYKDIRLAIWIGIFSRRWISASSANKKTFDHALARKIYDATGKILSDIFFLDRPFDWKMIK